MTTLRIMEILRLILLMVILLVIKITRNSLKNILIHIMMYIQIVKQKKQKNSIVIILINYLKDETAKSGSTKTITGSVVPVLGVSSISLLLYKVIENLIDIHKIIIHI
ncbi:hypothetical protein PVBG_06222 [Plasmodium vivax Brazil I]|uniref:Uncharacterized protein n=1 Tax=Plasmodium vivax (strain Brazil I) TaxID=1033975 RepID=A0A0J9SKC9_PLAV1|nr:hypothetical protein PVBG_06222 [Plasmodium vivax Brazil I]